MSGQLKRLSVIACCVLAAVTGCTSGGAGAQDKADEIRIGVLEPLSGANATTGIDCRNGADLAAALINGDYPDINLPLAHGKGLPGLGGTKIKLVSADTKSDPGTGASEAERLVTDQKAIALTGAYQSAVTKTISDRAERLRVPFVNGDSSSTSLTARGLDYFFRTGPTDLIFGQTFFSLLKDQAAAGVAVGSVGILHTNDQYGSDGATVTQQLAKENNFPVAVNVGYDGTATDMSPYVEQVRSANPGVLFLLSYISDSLLVAKSFQQLGYLPPAVMSYGAGASDPKFVAGPQDKTNATGFIRRTSWSPDIAGRNPTAKKIADLFQKRYHAPMTENSARDFTAVMTLALAINDARTTDPKKIRSALQNIDIPGRELIMPWDGVKFDDNHQNTGARGVIEQYDGGQWRVVYPNDVQSQKIIWPLSAARK